MRAKGQKPKAEQGAREQEREQLRRELVELWSAHNLADDGDTRVEAEYLEVIAVRSGGTMAEVLPIHQETGAKPGTGRRPVSQRAQSLANKIEEGAAGLAAFAAQLSDDEWHTPVSLTDHRTVGVVVHHVATMYPIEIHAAQAIAAGKPVTDVTWEVVAGRNAEHAREQAQAGVTKAAAIELLRKNSSEAAAAVRAFTDEQLDTAAPFSLTFGAPVTAQYVIEDHAMRHSWHHLAKIRRALAR